MPVMSKKFRYWEDIEPPTEEGTYWVQWFTADGSCDGVAELEWIDPEAPGWVANRSCYSWARPEPLLYRRGDGSGVGFGQIGRPKSGPVLEPKPNRGPRKFKMSWDDVCKVRTLEGKHSAIWLGEQYGVSRSYIHDIWSCRTRTHQ